MDIEKTYWGLKGGSGKFDEDIFRPYVSPPVPDDVVSDLFRAVDINKDGHIDLTEMIQLIAASCKKTDVDGHKCLFLYKSTSQLSFTAPLPPCLSFLFLSLFSLSLSLCSLFPCV